MAQCLGAFTSEFKAGVQVRVCMVLAALVCLSLQRFGRDSCFCGLAQGAGLGANQRIHSIHFLKNGFACLFLRRGAWPVLKPEQALQGGCKFDPERCFLKCDVKPNQAMHVLRTGRCACSHA